LNNKLLDNSTIYIIYINQQTDQTKTDQPNNMSEKAVVEVSKKMKNICKSQGGIFGKMAIEQKCYVGNMKEVDKDGTLEVSYAALELAVPEFRVKSPDTALMLVTVSPTKARVLVDIPVLYKNVMTTQEWLEATSMKGATELDLEDGQYLKFRDTLITEAFVFLEAKNLLEEKSDEECYSFDE
jgi:hypothetical protein